MGDSRVLGSMIDGLPGEEYYIQITHLQLAAGSKVATEKSRAAFAFCIDFKNADYFPAAASSLRIMRTFVYVDGFNLYYRMLKARPGLKWLNPARLASEVLHRSHEISRVNYYTARISQRTNDPDAPARQATYLRALTSVPQIRVHEGAFLTSEPWMKLAEPLQAKPGGYQWSLPPPDLVRVVKTEEKGSDVNLGAHLVRDAFLGAFDVAVVLTNDSDLVEPIRIATTEAGKRVGLLVPVKFPNQSLMAAASFHLHIRTAHLRRAQFDAFVGFPDGGGVTRPASWIAPSH